MTYRDEVWEYLEANWTATPIYALDEAFSLENLPPTDDIILMVDFPPSVESMVSIAVHQANGFREDGAIQLVFASPAGQGGAAVRAHGEALRSMLRGRRLGQTVMSSVDPFSATGLTDGKWQLWVSLVGFYRDAFQ